MTMRLLLRRISVLLLCVSITQFAYSQTKQITGTVTDSKGQPVAGASVAPKGSRGGTTTSSDGTFTLNTPASTKNVVVSSVGFAEQTIDVSTSSTITVSLVSSTENLNDVVVIGYGTARRKDISGSFATVSAKNFNQGVPASTPDQLLQGKVAGLEITQSSGQPGAVTIVKVRGNNSIRANTNPLYVVDGVPLDGRSARPSFSANGIGQLPDANPLNFLNSSDIESITVLKDASASAIYGSRGANGVILITTRTGSSGPVKIDAGVSFAESDLMKKPDVMSPSEYRTALQKYGAKSDSGASYTPFDKIIQHKLTQNYNVGFSGGTGENSRYRASFLASSTPGLIRKSALDKYVANFNASYKFLDKKLTVTYGLTAAKTREQIAPVSTNAGSTGNIISNAMQWNPTLVMQRSALDYTTNPNGQINPLLWSKGYNDYANVTSILGNVTAAYKILPSLEYKFLYGVNYSTGDRGEELLGFVNGTGGNNTPNADGKGGVAQFGSVILSTQTLTHTLTYNKAFGDLDFTALVGYEYFTTSLQGKNTATYGFDYNNSLSGLLPIHLYDNIQDGLQKNLVTSSFKDPTADIQSEFARVSLNYKNRYSITGSFRDDGSSKFGANNKHAYFPAVSGKWSISEENFMKNQRLLNNLALRVGWGSTGNQEFPAGAASDRYQYTSNGSLSVVNFGNKDLKWETITSTNAGIDLALLNNKLKFTFDYFDKKTKDPLFPAIYAAPAPAGTIYRNLPGYITNKGFEFSIDATIVQTSDWLWAIGGTFEYVKNKFVNPISGKAPLVNTGQLNGKGTSATYVQAIANNQPIDVFFLRKFHGFDQNGFAMTDGAASYAGDPNPNEVVGFYTEVDYKKLSFILNAHGAFGYVIYNNTLQSVTGLSFINNGGNIAKTLIGTKEAVANPVSASTRYLYSGNYMKLGNATLRYKIGDIGHYVKGVGVFFSCYNVFAITKYPGFDPEVNTSTADANGTGIPSRGIDYIGYPTPRTFTLGLNFSLQ